MELDEESAFESVPPPRARKFLSLRLAILMLALAGVCLYASSVVTRHKLRRSWHRTVNVGVVLLGPGGVELAKRRLIEEGLPRLNAMMEREFAKYDPDAHIAPARFELAGTAGVLESPPMPPDDADYFARALHAFRLWRYLAKVHETGDMKMSGYDSRLYVMLIPAAPNATRFVEGIGAKDGDVGVISTQLDDNMLDITLLAIGHEFLHGVGATDKYDPDGHTDTWRDLPEPDRQPRYPQRFAEIMVGEIATSPVDGRLPDRLEQVAVGPKTAHEVGWLRDEAPEPAVAAK